MTDFLLLLLLFPVLFYLDREIMLKLMALKAEGSMVFKINEFINPFINFVAHGATQGVVSFLIYIVGKFLYPPVYKTGRILFVAVSSVGILGEIVKRLFGRPRPALGLDRSFAGPSFESGYDSFPSGHTAIAFCMAYVVSYLHPRYKPFVYGFAFAVGIERVKEFVHFPSDVLAGAILGSLWGRFLISQTERRNFKWPKFL